MATAAELARGERAAVWRADSGRAATRRPLDISVALG
jgi:hypothetical protein